MSAVERLRRPAAIELPHGPLVTTGWLHAHLDHPRVRVFDVRGRILPPGAPGPAYAALREDYAAAHLPGAHFLDWTRYLLPRACRTDGGEAAGALAAALARAEVSRDDVVVLYDDLFSLFASRGACLLGALGYERARVLDGGWTQWRDDGRPVTAEPPIAAGCPAALLDDRHVGADTDALVRALTVGAVVDARLPAAYEGRVGRSARRGHVPGAVNVPYNRLVSGQNGRFAPPPQVRHTLDRAGLNVARLPDELVIYCDTGAMASAVWAAFESVGVRHARVYEPTFAAWADDPTRPVSAGPRP